LFERHSKENNAMETKARLHPLLTAAAISVTVFSAIGAATLTGLMPPSVGSQKDEPSLQVPQEPAKPADQAVEAPAPAKKIVQQKPAARVAATPRPVQPAVYRDYAEPRYAQVEAPKPVVQYGHLGTVQAVREVKDPGQHTALGPIAGGIAGAVIGDQIGKGKGNTRKVLTVLGAAGGAFAGREIEKHARGTTHWEIDVRRDDGRYETVRSEVAPPWQPGERVRLVDGRLQAA
jgi:outer membrane lipoprotein SlyB